MLELVAVELGGGLAVETQAPRLNLGVVRQVMAQHGPQRPSILRHERPQPGARDGASSSAMVPL